MTMSFHWSFYDLLKRCLKSKTSQIFLWNYNMSDLWQSISSLLIDQRISSTSDTSTSNWNINQIWEELKLERRPSDQRAGLLHINMMGSINHVVDLEKLVKSIPSWMSQVTKLNKPEVGVSVTKYRMMADYEMRIPTEMGLPLHLRITLPMIMSAQGVVQYEKQGNIKSDINTELSWKLNSELRVLLPFNGNYVTTGVDCRVELRAPKEMTWSWKNGAINVTWILGNEVTDLAYYHVKPYIISRNMNAEQPTMEDESLVIIGQSGRTLIDIPLTTEYGVQFRTLPSAESIKHYDMVGLVAWLKKWDVSNFSDLKFVPLKLESQQLAIRYDPRGNRATSVSGVLQWQWVIQDAPEILRFKSGAASPWPSSTRLRSQKPITKSIRDVAARLFRQMNSGIIPIDFVV